MNEFEAKVLNYINQNDLIVDDQPILVAFSGGADSTALLYVLDRLIKNGFIRSKLIAIHINHNLRGKDSDCDERFTAQFASELNIKYYCESVDVEDYAQDNGISIELAARYLRRDILFEAASKLGCSMIATAHHKDDNAETIIHRLSRGTGIKGLGGIWQKRDIETTAGRFVFIRPLLCVDRKQIENYCVDRNLEWRHDKSNDEIVYTRNLIRHQILPQLQAQSKHRLCDLLDNLSQICRRLYNRISEYAEFVWKEIVYLAEEDSVVIDFIGFNKLSPIIRQEILRIAYNSLGGKEAKITQQHYEQLIEFACQSQSAKMQLPGEIYFFRGYGRLIMQKITSEGLVLTKLTTPGNYSFKQFKIQFAEQAYDAKQFKDFLRNKSCFEECFDADKVKLPLKARNRETGDKFVPIGQQSVQKVGKFLIGAKVNHHERQQVVIFEDANNEIVWVAPFRSSEKTKVNAFTNKIYKIKIS